MRKKDENGGCGGRRWRGSEVGGEMWRSGLVVSRREREWRISVKCRSTWVTRRSPRPEIYAHFVPRRDAASKGSAGLKQCWLP